MSDYDTPSIDSVWAAPETLLDHTLPPPPKVCTCGAVHEWKWWPGRTVRGLVVRPRWVPPSVDDVKGCTQCLFIREMRAQEQETSRRQQIVGIANAHRAYSWSRTVTQGPHELWHEFAWRVKVHAGMMGVCRDDVAASRAIQVWGPKSPGMFLCGPVGTGKSLWVSARLTALVAAVGDSELHLTVDQLMRRGVPEERAIRTVEAKANIYITPGTSRQCDCLLIDEEEVVRRVELAWKGDQVPLLRIARVQVLAYDDLGTVLIAGSPKARDLARTCIDRLVDLRWREQRPMLCTSNRTLDEVCDAMSRRTADRLRELCPVEVSMRGIPSQMVAEGFSWRRLPPKPKES